MHDLSEAALLEKIRSKQATIYRLDTFDNSLIMDLLVSTKLSRTTVRRLGARTAIMNEPYVQKRAAQPFKRYEHAPVFDLAQYGRPALSTALSDLAATRRSCKAYSGAKVAATDLASMLGWSYGVARTELLHEARIRWRFRPIPSPGGLFASEIYLILINSDLPAGLYHYRPDLDALEQLRTGDFAHFAASSCGVDPYVDSADKIAGVILTTSMIERLYIKYGERTYKFMMIETGLLAQQLTLTATALGLGSCMLGGYFDDEVHDFLGVDGVLESVQNVMVFGHSQSVA